MSTISYLLVNIVGTLLRFLPWSSPGGLVEIGQPDESSPVLVTCNYRLTVERVRRCLRGMDVYLLVANSDGINVWCAATGGRLTSHDVVSVLKTSGIEEKVRHRKVILPQLAATGVEAGVVESKSGWQVIWGPVYAQDLPRFLGEGPDKGRIARMVRFPLTQRVEMAIAYAFPISLLVGVVTALWWRQTFVPAVVAVWALCLAVYLSFPVYSRRLGPGGKGSGVVLGGLLAAWAVAMVCAASYLYLVAGAQWGGIARWGALTLVVLLVLGIDLLGSTPVYKSGLHEDRRLHVELDLAKCHGAGACVEVCPRDCYELDQGRGKVSMPGSIRCVQCGACIVQCPCDALSFATPDGGTITPETVRRFKLNLMGARVEE
jgi:ferredoxin